MTQQHVCPHGGDIEDNCADCVYSVDYVYNYETSECVQREVVETKKSKTPDIEEFVSMLEFNAKTIRVANQHGHEEILEDAITNCYSYLSQIEAAVFPENEDVTWYYVQGDKTSKNNYYNKWECTYRGNKLEVVDYGVTFLAFINEQEGPEVFLDEEDAKEFALQQAKQRK